MAGLFLIISGALPRQPSARESLAAVKRAVEHDTHHRVEGVGRQFFGTRHEIPGGVVDDRVDQSSSASAFSAADSTAAKSRTSQVVYAATPPAWRIASQVSFNGSSRRPMTNIFAPSDAKCSAMERPRPEPPPLRKMARSRSRSF